MDHVPDCSFNCDVLDQGSCVFRDAVFDGDGRVSMSTRKCRERVTATSINDTSAFRYANSWRGNHCSWIEKPAFVPADGLIED
ncbi:hypothetical protein RRSWK_00157 [Rhodopirellula sp. SWK7]|nr:hypothetical protein RRSWK_00157 [Rhodopirellula sp. SWK7]